MSGCGCGRCVSPNNKVQLGSLVETSRHKVAASNWSTASRPMRWLASSVCKYLRLAEVAARRPSQVTHARDARRAAADAVETSCNTPRWHAVSDLRTGRHGTWITPARNELSFLQTLWNPQSPSMVLQRRKRSDSGVGNWSLFENSYRREQCFRSSVGVPDLKVDDCP